MKPWYEHYDKEVKTSYEYPKKSIPDILDDSAQVNKEKTLTLFYGKRLTYAQIKEASDKLAAALIETGVLQQDKVALLLPNFPGFLIAYYGVLKTKATVVPLNPLYTEEELEYQLKDSNAIGIIGIPIFAKKIASLSKKLKLKFVIIAHLSGFMAFPLNMVMRFKEKKALSGVEFKSDMLLSVGKILKSRIKPLNLKIDANLPAVIIYSGGTTGVAKGIVLSHKAVVTNAFQISKWGHLNDKERILAVLPLFHGYGMNVCMNSAVLNGMSIVLLPRFKAKEMAKAIEKYKPTLTAVVPTILTALYNLPNISSYDFTSLKAVWVGAAPLTKAAKEKFESKAGCRVIEGYGLTESVTAIMANPYMGKHKVGSIGLPFPDVDAKIVSHIDSKTELKANEQGEIVLKTPTLMMEYYNKPKETSEAVRDGWLYTGDIGYMDDEGYFYITDRKKDLIIVGGFNVFPREIDEVLYKHPKVKEGIAVGIPDEYKGEKIKVFVVLKDNESAAEDEFKEYFRKHLAPYKVPSEIEFRDSLPKSAIGKILRRVLRQEEIKKAGNLK